MNSPKIVKLAPNIIDTHLTNINNDLLKNSFPEEEEANTATVRPIYREKDHKKFKTADLQPF